MTPGTHGSTFGGNPLAMAAAAVVLDVLTEDGFMQDVRDRAAYLESALTNLQSAFPAAISEIRGRGFLRGICLAEGVDLMALVSALRGDHVLCVPAAENTLRLLPPLIISREEIDILMAALHRQLGAA
jgi:acetylornithine/N-succinyldiaminopimelate aminotransferase